MSGLLSDLGPALVQAVFPARCPGCATATVGLCPACRARLAPAPPALPPDGVDWWVAAFAYHGAVRALVAGAKYRGARAGWAWLARELAGRVRGAQGASALELVTWPPTTAARRRRRGFDPAEWLARRVARELALPARGVLRRQPGPAQTGRDRRARAESGPAFTARFSPGRSVLVVDDVSTTGATLAAAAGALRSAGADSVAAATATRTPFDPTQNSRSALKRPRGRADSLT